MVAELLAQCPHGTHVLQVAEHLLSTASQAPTPSPQDALLHAHVQRHVHVRLLWHVHDQLHVHARYLVHARYHVHARCHVHAPLYRMLVCHDQSHQILIE